MGNNKSGSGRGLFPPSVLTALLIMMMGSVGVRSFSRGVGGGGGEGMGGCVESEGKALLDLKKGIDPNGTWLSSWREGGDCCGWHGIRCDHVTGHVVELHLRGQYNYSDDHPPSSSLNPVLISSLPHLRYLDPSSNNFNGSHIPELIGSLAHLKHLDLSFARLGGIIPWQLGNLSNLQSLSLSRNFLTGIIPWQLGNLSNLQSLDLSWNQGLHAGDSLIWLSKMTFLTHLDLSYTNLSKASSSVLQRLGSLNNLAYLALSGNVIDASIPTALWNLSRHLLVLDLGDNRLTGEIPEGTSNSSRLERLDLSRNDFAGPVPKPIENLSNLWYLDLSHNRLNGQLPNFNLTQLFFIDLSNNSLSGSIHESLGTIGPYRKPLALNLGRNHLSGHLPLLLCNPLDLSNNNLRGEIPSFRNDSSSPFHLHLSNNHLSGKIPTSFRYLTDLTSLNLDNNLISGRIPLSLKYCKQLINLNLNGNRLSGSIPTWIGENLTSLTYLGLGSNLFTGYIPMQLSYLLSLQVLDLSNNRLIGHLSLPFEKFVAMNKPHNATTSHYYPFAMNLNMQEQFALTTKGVSSIYTTILPAMTSIDLSSNNFHGEIPNGITQLLWLRSLNLSRNNLTGKIPKNIGTMKQLESLDLSVNQLSGGGGGSYKHSRDGFLTTLELV